MYLYLSFLTYVMQTLLHFELPIFIRETSAQCAIAHSASMFETIQDKNPWTDSPVPFKRRIPQLTVHAKSSLHKKFNQILKKEQ